MRKVMSPVIAAVFLVSMLVVSPVSAANLDVPADYATIQQAIDNANNGDVIRVAQGTYYENLVMTRPLQVTIEGGWDAGFASKADDPSLTKVDGNDAASVLWIEPGLIEPGPADVTIRNMTMQNGFTDDHGACIFTSADYCDISLTLIDMILQDCNAIGEYSPHGGAVSLMSYCNELVAHLENVVIRRNHTDGGGGALYVWVSGTEPRYPEASVYVVNCLIYDNIAATTWAGGGVRIGSYGTGLLHMVILNSTITGNTSNSTYFGGGGVFIGDSEEGYGGTTTTQIYNSIIYGNTANPGADVTIATTSAGSNTEIYYSDIGELNPFSGIYDYDAISTDPLFTDQANKDFHLQPTSPCIDAGRTAVPDPPGLPEFDIEGNPRVWGTEPDMGAYEVPGPTVTWNLAWGLDVDAAAVNIWTYPGDAVAVTLASVEWSMPSGLLVWHYGGPTDGWRFYKKGWGAVNTLETLIPGKGYIGIVPTASLWLIPQGG